LPVDFLSLPTCSVNDLLLIVLKDIFGSFRAFACCEAAQATGVEAEDVVEVGSLFKPFVQHFCEGEAFIEVTSRLSNVTELVDDFNAVF